MDQDLTGRPRPAPSPGLTRGKPALRNLLRTGACLYLLLVATLLWALLHPPQNIPPPHIEAIHRLPSTRTDKVRLAIRGTGLTADTRVSLTLDTSGRKSVLTSLPTYGRPENLILVGKYALVANGYRGLLCVEIADPRHPRIVGSLKLPGKAWNLRSAGNLLLVTAMKGGVQLVDISNPAQPHSLGKIDTENPAIASVAGKGVAYVFTTDHQLTVYDIRDPAAPIRVAQLPLPGIPWQGTLLGPHLLVSCRQAGLVAIDVRAPRQPRIEARLPLPGSASSITVSGKYGFVAAGNGGIQIVDLADPGRPKLIAGLPTPGYTYQVTIVGNRAFLADGSSGLQVVDISNPRHPVLRHSVDSPGSVVDVVIHDRIAILADRVNGLELIDLADLPPLPTTPFTFPASLRNIKIAGSLALVAAERSGLLVLDIMPTSGPHLIGQFDTPGDNHDLAIRGRLVYLADGPGGVQIVDISDPHHPELAGHIDIAGHITSVAIQGNLLLAGEFHRRLQLFDLRENPKQPRTIAELPLPAAPRGIHAVDDKAYIACGPEGLLVVALDDPERPRIVGKWQSAWPQRDLPDSSADKVLVQDQIAYIAYSGGGLDVVDISNPGKPRLLAHRGGLSNAAALAVGDNLLYVADLPEGEIATFDISDPRRPVEVATLPTPGKALGLTWAGDRLYAVGGFSGLVTLSAPEISETVQGDNGSSRVAEMPVPAKAGNYTVRVFNNRGFDEFPGGVIIEGKRPTLNPVVVHGKR